MATTAQCNIIIMISLIQVSEFLPHWISSFSPKCKCSNFYLQMVCRNVTCHEHSNLVKGECVYPTKVYYSKLDRASCYSYFVKLVPVPDSRPLGDFEQRITTDIEDTINSFTLNFVGMHYQYLYFISSNNDRHIEFVVLYMLIQFEKGTHRLAYIRFIDRLMNMQSSSVVFQSFGITFNVEVAQYNYTFDNGSARVCVPNQFGRCKKELRTDYDRNFLCSVEETFMVSKLYVCPFIQFHINDFPCKIENDFLICAEDATFNRTTKVLSKWEYEIHEETIDICLRDYEDIYLNMSISKSKTGVSSRKPFHPKNIISLVCICFSIVCLLVTIVTYGRFSSLQSQPGINNMILSVFLLLAQSFYQFGSGQNSVSDWACSLIGGICHFLWLSVMFAMNNCCTQMFLIFKKHYLISPKYEVKQTVRNILYVTCSSLLFVFVNLIASLVVSNGQNSGYGGRLCYLSSPIMQLITFVIPSALTLLVNGAMFSYVVYEIGKVGSATTMLNKERNYLQVYVRLSALTGLTWTFGFLQIVLKTEILEFIFIILNASQGVFIMVAFVLNKRVLLLYCKTLFLATETPVSGDRTRFETTRIT